MVHVSGGRPLSPRWHPRGALQFGVPRPRLRPEVSRLPPASTSEISRRHLVEVWIRLGQLERWGPRGCGLDAADGCNRRTQSETHRRRGSAADPRSHRRPSHWGRPSACEPARETGGRPLVSPPSCSGLSPRPVRANCACAVRRVDGGSRSDRLSTRRAPTGLVDRQPRELGVHPRSERPQRPSRKATWLRTPRRTAQLGVRLPQLPPSTSAGTRSGGPASAARVVATSQPTAARPWRMRCTLTLRGISCSSVGSGGAHWTCAASGPLTTEACQPSMGRCFSSLTVLCTPAPPSGGK